MIQVESYKAWSTGICDTELSRVETPGAVSVTYATSGGGDFDIEAATGIPASALLSATEEGWSTSASTAAAELRPEKRSAHEGGAASGLGGGADEDGAASGVQAAAHVLEAHLVNDGDEERRLEEARQSAREEML